jgi:hypothetical protein
MEGGKAGVSIYMPGRQKGKGKKRNKGEEGGGRREKGEGG